LIPTRVSDLFPCCFSKQTSHSSQIILLSLLKTRLVLPYFFCSVISLTMMSCICQSPTHMLKSSTCLTPFSPRSLPYPTKQSSLPTYHKINSHVFYLTVPNFSSWPDWKLLHNKSCSSPLLASICPSQGTCTQSKCSINRWVQEPHPLSLSSSANVGCCCTSPKGLSWISNEIIKYFLWRHSTDWIGGIILNWGCKYISTQYQRRKQDRVISSPNTVRTSREFGQQTALQAPRDGWGKEFAASPEGGVGSLPVHWKGAANTKEAYQPVQFLRKLP